MGAEKYGNGLAQAATPEEFNLICKINQCTDELYKSISAIDDKIDGINKELLPLQQDSEKEISDKKEPSGWLEKHFDYLMGIAIKSEKINGKLIRLDREIKNANS